MAATARAFESELAHLRPPGNESGEPLAGIPMGRVFALARQSADMPLDEVERLLASPHHAARVGAVSVMDFQARSRKTQPDQRRELFELYLRRHDLIDTWDLVDRAAIHVVGEYLVGEKRDVLDRLAESNRPMERRTAILSTYAFIRRGELDHTYRIAARLAHDPEDLVRKAVGWMLREAGNRDRGRLVAFLEPRAPTMPRITLRYAIEKLDEAERRRLRAIR